MFLKLLALILVAVPITPITSQMPAPATILAETRRVADWQLAHRNLDHVPAASRKLRTPRDWQQATFWVALTELAARDAAYAPAILALGRQERWRLGERSYHADDQLISQAWEWASRHGGGAMALVPTRAYFEHILANRPKGTLKFVDTGPGNGDPACTIRWCWCDALFMAPPSLIRLSIATGDPRFADFAHAEFAASTNYLLDREEHLFFRDSRFFDQRDAEGRKLFWSRGNGWVMAGLARIISQLDVKDRHRAYYVELFREMAARLVTLQKADGYWSPSLLANGAGTPPESSGTGFFVYAFAWGVRTGILDEATYRPAAVRGWAALGRAVQPDGMLGWVQQVSDRPDMVQRSDTQFYGTGAYILAGTAMYDLAKSEDDQ